MFMMRPKELSRRLTQSWSKVKILIILAFVALLLGGLVLVLAKFKKTSSHSNLATTSLSVEDSRFAAVLVFLKEKGLEATSSSLSGNTMNFNLGKTVVTISLSSDLNQKLEVLWQVWHQYQILGKTLKKIDLRFSYPLVSY